METVINSAYTVFTETLQIDKIDREQILRYAGYSSAKLRKEIIRGSEVNAEKGADYSEQKAINDLIDKCYPKMFSAMKFKSCYIETTVKITENLVSFGVIDSATENFQVLMKTQSKNLSTVLRGCDRAILVAATAGIEADMIVRRAEVTSKAEALILNSIAIAGIEKYMAVLNEFFKNKYSGFELRPRFSPGYGDVPLALQKDLLSLLDTKRKIGVALSDSLLMTPTKSVSAIIGIGKEGCVHIDKDCDMCSKKDCEYRLS